MEVARRHSLFATGNKESAMSRSSPTGFVFSIALEIAAVVAIVSFLPRVDLRPLATQAAEPIAARASANQPGNIDRAISPVSWTAPADITPALPPRETTYSERRPAAPPLIEADPARSQYVEQRLDRASQQLVNSVGSYVAQAAGGLASYQPSTVSPPSQISDSRTTFFAPAGAAPSAIHQQQPPASSPGLFSRRQTAGSFSTQPRPWLRY